MLGAHRRKAGAGRAVLALAALAVLLPVSRAQAREAEASATVIRDSDAPITYAVELEPHLLLGSAPPGGGVGSGVGLGARASVVLAPQGFIDGINDSVAIGFGLDFGHYAAQYGLKGYRDQCTHFAPGPAGTSVCTSVTSEGGTYNYLFLPIVMQWNFWFTERWSAFGEPGLDIFHLGNSGFGITPALYLGGRFRLTDTITITARLGYPTLGIGASFMM